MDGAFPGPLGLVLHIAGRRTEQEGFACAARLRRVEPPFVTLRVTGVLIPVTQGASLTEQEVSVPFLSNHAKSSKAADRSV